MSGNKRIEFDTKTNTNRGGRCKGQTSRPTTEKQEEEETDELLAKIQLYFFPIIWIT